MLQSHTWTRSAPEILLGSGVAVLYHTATYAWIKKWVLGQKVIMAVEVRDSGLQERQFLDNKLMGFVVWFKSDCVLFLY